MEFKVGSVNYERTIKGDVLDIEIINKINNSWYYYTLVLLCTKEGIHNINYLDNPERSYVSWYSAHQQTIKAK